VVHSPHRKIGRDMNSRVASLLLGAGTFALLGGWPGIVIGTAVAAFLPIALDRLEPASVRQRRERLAHDAGDIAESLAAILMAGASLERAVDLVLRTCSGPSHAELTRTLRAMNLGAGPQAWTDLARRVPPWRAFAAPIARALTTGAPVAEVLIARVAATRHIRHDEALARARRIGIRATLPVGLLLLPGFILLAIVPLVASLVGSLLTSM
jgi:Flp pilus assembly protein TadB